MGKAKKVGGEIARLADHRVLVDEDLVAGLEFILSKAKRGEFASLSCFGMLRDGGCHTYFSATDDVFRDMAMLERLKHRMQVNMDDQA